MARNIGPVRIKAVQLRKSQPNITLQEIGKICGVTKQRIYKIFLDEKIPRRPKKHKKFKFCRNCQTLINSSRSLFCDEKCREEALFSSLPCSFCGKSIKYRNHVLKYKLHLGQYNFFCNKACFNKKQRIHT